MAISVHLEKLLNDAAVQRLFDILKGAGIEGRLVGGCVRDALLGVACSDIDMAVDHPPQEVLDCLAKAQLRVIPTGLQHGTLTALVNGKGIEVTSLRRDVTTDGRHAEVLFTSAWEEDAARRDFTFNALYCDANGQLYDYFTGLRDLATHTLRFIGDPTQRIHEDYLRILRYYRFQLRYGGELHSPSRQAVQALVPQLMRLSNERIQAELMKMLSHPDPVHMIRLMNEDGVFDTLFGRKAETEALERWSLTQAKFDALWPPELDIPFSLGRLHVLFPQPAVFFQKSLRLSRKEAHLLTVLYNLREMPLSEEQLFAVRFEEGDATAWLWLLSKGVDFSTAQSLSEAFCVPVPAFPLRGADLIAEGLAEGPDVGRLLKACQQQWLQKKGQMSLEDCLDFCRGRALPTSSSLQT